MAHITLRRGRTRAHRSFLGGLLFVAAMSPLAVGPSASGQTCRQWTGPSVITPQQWANPSNWAGFGVPNSSQRICFNVAVHLLALNISVHSIVHRGVLVNNTTVTTLGQDTYLNPASQDVSGWVLINQSKLVGWNFTANSGPLTVANGDSTISSDCFFDNLSNATVNVGNAALTLVRRPTGIFDAGVGPVPGCSVNMPTQTFTVNNGSVRGLSSSNANVTALGSVTVDGFAGSLTAQCSSPQNCAQVSTKQGLSLSGPLTLNSGRISGTMLRFGAVTSTTAASITIDRLHLAPNPGGTSYPGSLDVRQALEVSNGTFEIAGTSMLPVPVKSTGTTTGALRNLGSLTLSANATPNIEGAAIENIGQATINGVVAAPRSDIVNRGTISIGDGATLQPRNFTNTGTVSLNVNPFVAAAGPRIASAATTTLGGTLSIRTPLGPVGAISWIAVSATQRVGTFTNVIAPERPVSVTYTQNAVLVGVN